MAKPYIWIGKNSSDEIVKGEGYDENDCRLRAEAQGCVSFTHEENPDYSIEDHVQSFTPELTNQAASDKIKAETSDMQHLAEANARMFEQLNTLKDALANSEQTISGLHADNSACQAKTSDLRALILAWNTEQSATIGEAYVEPAFVAFARELA